LESEYSNGDKNNYRDKNNSQKLKIYNKDGSINVDLIFDILGNVVDRMIILKLAKVPRYASELAVDLGISKPAIKKHLEKLMDLGIIKLYHEKGQNRKRDYYCLDPEFGFTLLLDISQNYFNYTIQKTSQITQQIFKKVENELDEKNQIQASYYGVFGNLDSIKMKDNVENSYDSNSKNAEKLISEKYALKKLADMEVINQSLKQLCRALQEVESQIEQTEKERILLIGKKNEIIARLKAILNTLVKNPIERELIASFFFKSIKKFEKGINIREFLESIYLKAREKRAGVNLKETTPEYIKKQQEKIKMLEEVLKDIIKGFKFIQTKKDKETNQEFIVFNI